MDVTIEANRCLNCYDAPCTRACPTGIDVPRFIGRIATGDLAGSARTIMDANPIGASCARVCPTSQLCEGACVYHADDNPIRIGDLQRYATDWAIRTGATLFEAGASTGRRVAIVGAGPAGLSTARELARAGHAVTIFERDVEAGGLDTYGVVPFRLPAEIPLWEADQVRALGVEIRTGVTIGETIGPAQLRADFDAIVLAVGMGAVPRLGVAGEDATGVWDALDFIRRVKTGAEVGPLGANVAVIGGGNTAIDAATCSKRLGVPSVTMYYRRGAERMTAYDFELEFAKVEGVEFRTFAVPQRIVVDGGRVVGLELIATAADGSAQPVPGTEHVVAADSVILAIGQQRYVSLFDAFGVLHDANGIAIVDASMRTNDERIFAVGDCTFAPGATDATVVEAAQRGKVAAHALDLQLRKEMR